MLANYIKLAIRNLQRNKAFTALHVGGLALGITASLLLWTYVATEWRYNRFHSNLPNLYRVLLLDEDNQATDYTPPALGPWLKAQFPEVSAYTRTNTNAEGTITSTVGGTRRMFREEIVAYADADFFRMFSYPAAVGAPNLDGAQHLPCPVPTRKNTLAMPTLLAKP